MALKVAALAGGVGGAKLAHGLARRLSPRDLTIIVNTADDFEHFGLQISPDLDTVLYTLAGMANPETGWGRDQETWEVLGEMEAIGGPTWFQLGDRDLALHLDRTRRLRQGEALSAITTVFAKRFAVAHRIIPMSDDPVRTIVETTEGRLPFQEYFVKHACRPVVHGFEFAGSEAAAPAPGVLEAIEQAAVVIFCPSNPWVSIDPILCVPGIAEAVRARPVIGISPIIAGKALRGPAAKMYSELGITPSALAVAEHFQSYLSHFVIDEEDAALSETIEELGMQVSVLDTVMRTVDDRERLAGEVLYMAGAFQGTLTP